MDKRGFVSQWLLLLWHKSKVSGLLRSLHVIGYLSPALGTGGNGFRLGFSGFPSVAGLV